jgi:2-keto-3-deoxy-6-phosphogluconate aldolase
MAIHVLRGVRPREAVQIAGALIDAGIRFIEVPLNSLDRAARPLARGWPLALKV